MPSWKERNGNTELSSVQREVMDLVALGKTRAEIAMILGLDPMCVKGRVDAAKRKLGAHNTILAVAKYLAPDRFKK